MTEKNKCDVFIGPQDQSVRNTIERSAPPGLQKRISDHSDGFHNHSTLLSMSKFTPKKGYLSLRTP